MKILNNEQVLNTYQHESKTKAQPPVDQNFGTILKETLKYTKKAAIDPLSTPFTNPLTGFQPVSVSPSDHQFAVNCIEDMINLLDRYREKLANPRMTMKQIDPVIRKMTREMENITPVLDSLPADQGIKNILNQTLVTISLEISKFYRGDYISA